MAAGIRLIVDDGFRFTLAWAAPVGADDVPCAPAHLDFGDGAALDLGVLCPPTAVTWREQRQLDLGSHRYAGAGPYRARLTWGAAAAEALVAPAGHAELGAPPAAPPTVTLFALAPVTDQPMQQLVKLRVEGLAPGQRLRLDGGAAQVHWLSEDAGEIYAAEFVLAYAKPGLYRATLDLLDADGFWLTTLAETPLEIAFIEEAPAGTEAALTPQAQLPTLPGLTETLTEPQPWLPYRYVKPIRSGLATYTTPGGSRVSRSVSPGIYLSVRAETAVSSARWLQTAQGDWIAATNVTFFAVSAFRGVLLGDSGAPEPPSPTEPRRGIVTATTLNVRARPGVSADNPSVSQLRAGAEIAILEEQSVAGAAWYRIEEGRWVHGGYVRIVAEPAPTPNPPPPTPRKGIVTATVLNVRARPSLAADNPVIATLRTGAEVTLYETRTVTAETWYRIGENRWVAGNWVRLLDTGARQIAGADLTPPLPLGWVKAGSLGVHVRPVAAADNPAIGQVSHYQALPILEERAVSGVRWCRIGAGQWIDGRQLGIARARPRPASIGAVERWVGVSLAEQTLVAYEGDRAIYATLIASGLPGTPTVQGIFRTWKRLTTGKMSGPGYYLEDVTWTCYFYGGYALHTAYWHDDFGHQHSHGCVNLSPYDAWWIYRWSAASGANSPTVYVFWA